MPNPNKRKTILIDEHGDVVDYLLADENSDLVVPEGFGIRVPMQLSDGATIDQQIAQTLCLTDAAGNPAGSRPGFVYDSSTTARDAADRAYEKMVQRVQDAWRTPPAPVQQTESAQVLSPHQTHFKGDINALSAARQRAYEEMVRRTQDAWKTPR